MSGAAKTKRPSLILMIAPTLLVLISFYAFLFKSTNRQLLARRGEVVRLTDEQPQIQLQMQTLQAEFNELHRRIAAADQQRERLRSQQADAISRQAELGRRVRFSSAQAGTMNRVIARLGQNGLAIVANQSDSKLDGLIEKENLTLAGELNLASQAKTLAWRSTVDDEVGNTASLQPRMALPFVIAVGPAAAAAMPVALQPRQQHRITVQGRFANVRGALRSVLEDFPEITITSVELEQIDVRSRVRNWTISVSF